MDLPPPGRFSYAGDELVDAHERVQWQHLELARKIEYRDGFGQRVHLRKYSAPRYTCPGSFAYMPDSSGDHGGAARATVGGGESQKHMHAKYLLQKMAGRYKFLLSRCKSCDRCHVWETGQGLSGAVLEKRRAGFAYDVALLRDGEVAVALEVWHTHKTGKRKRETTRQGGVAFAEFDADEVLGMEGAKGVTTLTNLEVDVVECDTCQAVETQLREKQSQWERDRWLSETHVGVETRVIQLQERQTVLGYHALECLARTVDRDKKTKLPVKSCLRLVEEYQAFRHKLQADSVYESKRIRVLQRNLFLFQDCYDFVRVFGVGDFIHHHRNEWREISKLEKERKQRYGVKSQYEQGNSFKCVCKKWFLKVHRWHYLISSVAEQCHLKEAGVFVIERQHDAYCYLCTNCIGTCGACGSDMLLNDCVQFGFCKWCNSNLLTELFETQERCTIEMKTGRHQQRKIKELFLSLNYDPDLEKLRTHLSRAIENQRLARAELDRKKQEELALECLQIQTYKAEELKRVCGSVSHQQKTPETVDVASKLEMSLRPMQLKREILQNTRQKQQDVTVEPVKERKQSSELLRIANSRQKSEDQKMAKCMQLWLKPRDEGTG